MTRTEQKKTQYQELIEKQRQGLLTNQETIQLIDLETYFRNQLTCICAGLTVCVSGSLMGIEALPCGLIGAAVMVVTYYLGRGRA